MLMWRRPLTLAAANGTAQVNRIRGLLSELGLVVPLDVARLRADVQQIGQRRNWFDASSTNSAPRITFGVSLPR